MRTIPRVPTNRNRGNRKLPEKHSGCEATGRGCRAVSRGSLPGLVQRQEPWTPRPGWLSVLAIPRWYTCRPRCWPLRLVSKQKTLMKLLLLWVGVPAAAVVGGIVWAWLLSVIGLTYVWSIGVILIGVYYGRRARTESDRDFTLFVTVSVLGVLLAAAMLNAVG